MTYTRGDIITTLLNKGKNRNYIAGYLTAIEGYETQDPEKTNKDYSKGYEAGLKPSWRMVSDFLIQHQKEIIIQADKETEKELKEINAWVNQD